MHYFAGGAICGSVGCGILYLANSLLFGAKYFSKIKEGMQYFAGVHYFALHWCLPWIADHTFMACKWTKVFLMGNIFQISRSYLQCLLKVPTAQGKQGKYIENGLEIFRENAGKTQRILYIIRTKTGKLCIMSFFSKLNDFTNMTKKQKNGKCIFLP